MTTKKNSSSNNEHKKAPKADKTAKAAAGAGTKSGAHKPSGHTQSKSEPTVSHTPAKPVSAQPKLLIVLGLVAAAFLVSYNIAASKSQASALGVNQQGGGLFAAAAGGGCGMSGDGSGGGGGCCGGGGAPVEGATTASGDVQRIAVDTSSGSFNPNVIKAKAGVPIEIDFSQAPGGCLSGVLFPDFGIQQDLTAGPKTVKLPALEKGEYTFYCQMQMVSAKIVVE